LTGDKGSTWVVITARYLAPLQLKDLAGHLESVQSAR
jgi:hypothetical protein